jgi:ABC-2 type transport system permease protein
VEVSTVSEVRRQLAAPASWVIVGVFALITGAAFITTLTAFLDQSSQALVVPPPQPITINQLLIRPFLLQIGIAALLVLPLVTARASMPQGTGGPRVVLATFGGALTVYAILLLPSMMLVAVLFVYGAPEWGPIVSGYLGLLLIGATVISAGLFLSSLAASAPAAGVATFAIAFLLAASTWIARSGAPDARPVFRHFAVGEALDDFAKGVVDTGHVVSCLTIIALGLFLTRRTLEPRRSGS